jgi:glucose/arabinose dehydrogenase
MPDMKRPSWTAAAVVTVLTAAAACGSSTPPSNSDPSGSGERISGRERLGWTQSAADATELASFRFAAYVDNARVDLSATCGGSSGAFSCSSPMPPMNAGTHSIELVSAVVENGATIESGRSAPLRVTVTGATADAPPPMSETASARLLTTSDGAELRLSVLAEPPDAPTAFASAPDGRVFLAERQGRIRVVRDGVVDPVPAAVIDDVLVTAVSEGGLLALALDADFERTRFLYAAYTILAPEGSRQFRVVRFREVDGRLGERAVLLDGVAAAARPSVALGTGPDGRLYVAFDAATRTGRTAALASYNGKVLRLTTDGKTPEDQRAGPVFATDFHSPRGLDWQPSTGALWVADVKRPDLEELRVVDAAASASPRRIPLPAGTGAAALAFYRGTLLPAFDGDLFVAAGDGRHLLRLQLDPRDPSKVTSSERLLQDLDAPIRAVTVTSDGTLYVATDQAVLRLGPR